jgi:hypothetical protein
LSCRWLATAGFEALGRWGCRPHTPAFRHTRLDSQAARYRGHPSAWPAFCFVRLVLQTARFCGQRTAWQVGLSPPRPRFPLRSVSLAHGSPPRATKRLAGGAAAPTLPLSAALGFSCRRFANAGNKALGRWELPLPCPLFPLRSACLAGGSLQRATMRLVATAPTPPLFAALGLSCRRLDIVDNKALGRRGPLSPIPPLSAVLGLSCRRLATAGNGTDGTFGRLPTHPRFLLRSAFVLQTARYRWQRSAWLVGAAALTSPLSAVLGLSCRRLVTAGNEALSILRPHLRTRIAT